MKAAPIVLFLHEDETSLSPLIPVEFNEPFSLQAEIFIRTVAGRATI
jgi:hypothetical protein